MDAFSLPAVLGGLLFLAVLVEMGRPSAPPPAPTFVVMSPPAASNGGCGVSLVTLLLVLVAFAIAADFLGLFSPF